MAIILAFVPNIKHLKKAVRPTCFFNFSVVLLHRQDRNSTFRAFGPSQGLFPRHVELLVLRKVLFLDTSSILVHWHDKMFEIWDIMSCARSFSSTRRVFGPLGGVFQTKIPKMKHWAGMTAWAIGLLECMIAKDDIETSFLNTVPLWEFGLMY